MYLSYISVDEKGFKCVEIPYKEPYFSMLIILPDVTFGLQNVIKTLDIKTVKNIKNRINFRNERVLLKIPKFKIVYDAI